MNLPRVSILYALLAVAAIGAYFQPPLRFVAICIVMGCAVWLWGWLCIRVPLVGHFITSFLWGLLGGRR